MSAKNIEQLTETGCTVSVWMTWGGRSDMIARLCPEDQDSVRMIHSFMSVGTDEPQPTGNLTIVCRTPEWKGCLRRIMSPKGIRVVHLSPETGEPK